MKKKIKKASEEKHLMSLMSQIKKKNSDFFDVPDEYRNYPDIVKLQRELGIRISGKRGYDIIRDIFFVEENVRSNDNSSGMKLYISREQGKYKIEYRQKKINRAYPGGRNRQNLVQHDKRLYVSRGIAEKRESPEGAYRRAAAC